MLTGVSQGRYLQTSRQLFRVFTQRLAEHGLQMDFEAHKTSVIRSSKSPAAYRALHRCAVNANSGGDGGSGSGGAQAQVVFLQVYVGTWAVCGKMPHLGALLQHEQRPKCHNREGATNLFYAQPPFSMG